jgi:DnaJ family protein C protein 9
MPKSKEDPSIREADRSCLYEILGVTKDASDEQIKKAYRVRALQCHPDKNPSEEAKANFQKLAAAYNILRNPDSKKLYDETGFIEGEGFDKAADFFKTKFGRISEQDIVDFASKYKGSDAEIDDVAQYYENHSGNVSDLLEWVPLSEPQEVDRFVKMIDALISSGRLASSSKYKSSLPKLHKNAEKMAKEMEKFSKDHENKADDLNKLVLAIKEKRMRADESFLDNLIEKYGKPKKKSKK